FVVCGLAAWLQFASGPSQALLGCVPFIHVLTQTSIAAGPGLHTHIHTQTPHHTYTHTPHTHTPHTHTAHRTAWRLVASDDRERGRYDGAVRVCQTNDLHQLSSIHALTHTYTHTHTHTHTHAYTHAHTRTGTHHTPHTNTNMHEYTTQHTHTHTHTQKHLTI